MSAYLESTATNEDLFKFPRCLSVCPLTIEINQPDGSVTEKKTSYSRPNVFRIDI